MHLNRVITVATTISAATAMPQLQLQRVPPQQPHQQQQQHQAVPPPPPIAGGSRASTATKPSAAKASPSAAAAVAPAMRKAQLYHPDLVPDPWSWRTQPPVNPDHDNAERWQPPGPQNPKFMANFTTLLALSLATGIGEGMLGMVLARWFGVPALFVPTYGVVIGVTLSLVSLFVLMGSKVQVVGGSGGAPAADATRAADAAGLGQLVAKVERFAAEHGLRFRVVRGDSAKHAAELRRVERQVRMSLRAQPAAHDAQAA
jgi:hypothetical protein